MLDSGENWKWIGGRWLTGHLTIDIERILDGSQQNPPRTVVEKVTIREWQKVGDSHHATKKAIFLSEGDGVNRNIEAPDHNWFMMIDGVEAPIPPCSCGKVVAKTCAHHYPAAESLPEFPSS